MSKPLTGVRVLEVAGWTFVPSAGAVLAEQIAIDAGLRANLD